MSLNCFMGFIVAPTAADIIVNDVIMIGSACVGNDFAGGEV